MITSTITCDYCGEKIQNPEQTWLEIVTKLQGHASTSTHFYPTVLHVHQDCWAVMMQGSQIKAS